MGLSSEKVTLRISERVGVWLRSGMDGCRGDRREGGWELRRACSGKVIVHEAIG